MSESIYYQKVKSLSPATLRSASVLTHSDNKRVSGSATLRPNLLRYAPQTSDTHQPLNEMPKSHLKGIFNKIHNRNETKIIYHYSPYSTYGTKMA